MQINHISTSRQSEPTAPSAWETKAAEPGQPGSSVGGRAESTRSRPIYVADALLGPPSSSFHRCRQASGRSRRYMSNHSKRI